MDKMTNELRNANKEKEIQWVNELRSWQDETANSSDFINALKIDFFKDRIFAITPRGKVVDLPAGATPIDFAYQIHTDLGNQCIGARVNGSIVPLSYELRSSDIVEIITQKGKKPSASWLEFIKTSRPPTNTGSCKPELDYSNYYRTI